MENKNEIVLRLKHLLKATRAGRDIEDMFLDEKQKILTIQYKNGSKRKVDVAADSGIAIIMDALKVIY